MTTVFDRDTELTPAGPGRWSMAWSDEWRVAAGPNGGIVAAVMLAGCAAAVADPSRAPRTLTVHYVAPPRVGPAEVHAQVEKAGRGVSFVTCRGVQEGRLTTLAMAAFAAPRPPVEEFAGLAAPSLPPPERCHRLLAEGRGGEEFPIRRRWDTRWAVGVERVLGGGGGGGGGGGRVEGGGWLRLSERRAYDPLLLAAMADGWMPPILAQAAPPPLRVPTMELTVHFRDLAALAALDPADYCMAVFATDTSREGFLEESGEIWSPCGRLLAQSRQLAAIVPAPPGEERVALTLVAPEGQP
ncbi:MAG: acyl-CoA thioesterase [Acidimicrobiales bacterium]